MVNEAETRGTRDLRRLRVHRSLRTLGELSAHIRDFACELGEVGVWLLDFTADPKLWEVLARLRQAEPLPRRLNCRVGTEKGPREQMTIHLIESMCLTG